MSPNWEDSIGQINAITSEQELDALELHLLGRKQGLLTNALKELGQVSPEERKAKGQELNEWKQKITDAITQKRETFAMQKLGSIAQTDGIDISLRLPHRQPHDQGHLHLIPQFIRQIEDVFGRMGFDVAEGPEVESEDYNFSKLNIPKHHAARDMQGTFFVKDFPEHVMRTHTSPVQVRYMETHKPPFRMVCMGRCYRKDADATHSPMFHQVEMLMVGKDLSLANMKAVIIKSMQELISPDTEYRFRTSYFPFVEPGLELDMRFTDKGSNLSGKWLEIGGCGMVHPNVLKAGKIDPKEWRGYAFGFGIERLLMIRHQIPDLRSFYESDLRFVKQF